MRARRDREINIFNIAFLDVITGALGAFILLTVLLVAQAKNSGGADPAEVERLRQQNQQLAKENTSLKSEKEQAQSQSQEVKSLQQSNEDLRRELQQQKARASLVVDSSWACSGVRLRAYLWSDRTLPGGGQQAVFDPAQGEQDPYFNGDQHYKLNPTAAGISEDIWIDTYIHPQETRRLFYALQSPLSLKSPCTISVKIVMSGPSDPLKPSGPSNVLSDTVVGLNPVVLSAEVPWAFAGVLTVGDVVAGRLPVKIDSHAAILPEELATIDAWLKKTKAERGQ
jgi:hypothetical protein